jgi:dTDP-4-dehydrorhamnose 3,5-epimerase
MRFTPTPLAGAYVVDLEPFTDERGTFARAFCAEEFAARGLDPAIAQMNTSTNHRAGTLRGLHYQLDPPEAKFLRCVAGAVFDVMVDMRPDSATRLQWYGVEVSAANQRAVYLPPMFAHGYLALTDGATVLYSASSAFTPGAERGLRWDDPELGIDWPSAVTDVSDKDRSWPPAERGEPAEASRK